MSQLSYHYEVSKCKKGKMCVPLATKNTGVHGELVDEGSRLRLDARCLRILHADPRTGWHEERAVYQNVPVRSPVPPGPLILIRVYALCNLFN